MLAIIALIAALSSTTSPAPSLASLPPLTDPQRAAFERGESYERIVLAGQDPKWFAIEELHPLFVSDLDIFAGGKDFPADKGLHSIVDPLRKFLQTGDPSSIPSDLGGSSYFDPYFEKKAPDPSTWWFVEAGMADVEARASGGNIVRQALALTHPKWMHDHAAAGGAYGVALGSMPQSFDDIVREQAKIESLFEPPVTQPFARIDYPDGLMGYARLGLTFQTVAQMLDSPTLLAQPQAQAMINEVDAQLRKVAAKAIDEKLLDSWRASLVVDSDFDHDKAFGVNQQLSERLVKSMPKQQQSAFFVGMLGTQSVYNAIVFRDSSTTTEQLGALAEFTALDAEDSAIHDLRVRLASVSPTDWSAQVQAGRALVDEIESHP